MPATTRSGAPTAAPAVANKATKATQAKKSGAKGRNASQAKVNKANTTTNRVQKPISTGRNARGYVWVDEASHTVDDTSRTASPDFIPGIPPPSRRVVPETPPPSSQAEYEAEIARLRRKLQHRRRQPRRHRRSGREDSEAESSDTEAGDHPRVSFLHQTEEWEIVRIVGKRRRGKGYEYKVCWKKTWLLESELGNAQELLREFEANHQPQRGRKRGRPARIDKGR